MPVPTLQKIRGAGLLAGWQAGRKRQEEESNITAQIIIVNTTTHFLADNKKCLHNLFLLSSFSNLCAVQTRYCDVSILLLIYLIIIQGSVKKTD